MYTKTTNNGSLSDSHSTMIASLYLKIENIISLNYVETRDEKTILGFFAYLFCFVCF